jgi:phage-related baseplate assembly protein
VNYTPIDLSKLPPPKLVDELDFETIFSEMLAKLQELDPTFDALLESDPAYAILQVAAYRELLLRQTINDKAKARMLAYATGSDLDHIGADRGVARLDGESDDQFRARIVMAPEGWSTAGPIEAYEFHALSAHAGIKDVNVSSAGAGVVQVAVLSNVGNGQCYGARINHPGGYVNGTAAIVVDALKMDIASGTILEFEHGATFETDADAVITDTALTGMLTGQVADRERAGILPFVEDALSADTVRPLNDVQRVIPAIIVEYAIEAELTMYDGPDAEVVRQAAEEAAAVYAAEQHQIGRDITISGLMAALHQPGVQEVNLIAPAARIAIDNDEAAYCTSITVTAVGTDE